MIGASWGRTPVKRLSGKRADAAFMSGDFDTSVFSAEIDLARPREFRLGGSPTRRSVHVYPDKARPARWLILVRRNQTEVEYHAQGLRGGVPLAGAIVETRSLKRAIALANHELLRLTPRSKPERRGTPR